MSNPMESAVLYTEHAPLSAGTPFASVWSYEGRPRELRQPAVVRKADGSQEYWLERTDPLLNTMLPGTHVSLVVNYGDLWASGWSLASSDLLPRACLVGPMTRARFLRLGRSVCAMGAVIPPTFTQSAFGVSAVELVDHIVPLAELWPVAEVDRLFVSDSKSLIAHRVSALRDRLFSHLARPN